MSDDLWRACPRRSGHWRIFTVLSASALLHHYKGLGKDQVYLSVLIIDYKIDVKDNKLT